MSTNADLAALTEQLAKLRTDLDKVSKAAETLLRSAGADAVETGSAAWASAKETLERKIEERPIGAAAIALGIGVILGLLFGGRR